MSNAASGREPSHRCHTPAFSGVTVPVQPDWTCAVCKRIWRDMRTMNGVQWWAEVRGPVKS